MCLHLVEQRLMSVIRSCLLPTESVIVWSAQREKWGVGGDIKSKSSANCATVQYRSQCSTLDQQNSNTLPWH